MTKYELTYPNGEHRGIEVENFKEATEKYLRERLDTKLIKIEQRCYRDGRWTVDLRTFWFPNQPYYHKKYKLAWDFYDIRSNLDFIIEEFNLWINSQE